MTRRPGRVLIDGMETNRVSFDHDHPGDDHEYWTEAWSGEAVGVSKVGGGTVGQSYTGTWHWTYGTEHGSDLVTGSATTHAEAAEAVEGFFTEGY